MAGISTEYQGTNIKTGTGRLGIIGAVALVTVVFTVFRRLGLFVPIANWMADQGWQLTPIIFAVVTLEMISSAVGVLLVIPRVLKLGKPSQWLAEYFRVDWKAVLLGVGSFVVFGILGTVIALSMGIFRGDWSVVLLRPDITPDPDVVGWGYFLIALIPGIWEELGFRGLIQSRLQKGFSPTAAIVLSSVFFALFHFSSLMVQPASTVIGGVIMALLFGLAWGVMTVKARSIIPAVISHYLVDAAGQIFLNVDASDPVRMTIFFLLLSLSFPVVNILLTKLMYKSD